MSAERKYLHEAIDMVDENQLNVLYRVVCQFIPEDTPYPDEIEAIEKGRAEIARGEFVSFEDIRGRDLTDEDISDIVEAREEFARGEFVRFDEIDWD